MSPFVQGGFCTISQVINSHNEFDRERLAAFRRHLVVYLKQLPKVRDVSVGERFEKLMERMRKLIKDE
jgi:hypothetical protein